MAAADVSEGEWLAKERTCDEARTVSGEAPRLLHAGYSFKLVWNDESGGYSAERQKLKERLRVVAVWTRINRSVAHPEPSNRLQSNISAGMSFPQTSLNFFCATAIFIDLTISELTNPLRASSV